MSSTSSDTYTDTCGVVIPKQLRKILAQPRPISVERGGQTARELYNQASLTFDASRLSPFGLACFTGSFDAVTTCVEKGTAPDLSGQESAFCHGYVALTVLGAQRVEQGPPTSLKYPETLTYLLTHGTDPNIADILGYTALHHVVNAVPRADLMRVILEHGGNPDAQDACGDVPLMSAFQHNAIECIDVLLERGASLDIADGDNITPRGFCADCGPEVNAAVKKWIRARSGEEGVRETKICASPSCGKKAGDGVALSLCSRCRSVWYCSVPCQRSHWKMHKPRCFPFTAGNTVTVKPHFMAGYMTSIRTADIVRGFTGTPNTQPPPSVHTTPSGNNPNADVHAREGMIVKIQVTQTNNVPMLLYDRKRELYCQIMRGDNPISYDAIASKIRAEGTKGMKGYFIANLKNKDELVIQMRQLVSDQSW